MCIHVQLIYSLADHFGILIAKLSDCYIDCGSFTHFTKGLQSSEKFDVDVFLSGNYYKLTDKTFLSAWFNSKMENIDFNSFLTALSADLSKLRKDDLYVKVG